MVLSMVLSDKFVWADTSLSSGILPHSGRGISFKELNQKVRQTYNFAPSFCFFVPKYAADFLHRDYWTGTFDLSDLDAHNCIEHDASLTRESPCVPLVRSRLIDICS